jgi:hypothetical protein
MPVEPEFYDIGDSYCAGDPDPADIDWGQVAELEQRQQEVLSLSEDERPMAMLALLDEMYDGEAVIL